jgi:hypothetical protein
MYALYKKFRCESKLFRWWLYDRSDGS